MFSTLALVGGTRVRIDPAAALHPRRKRVYGRLALPSCAEAIEPARLADADRLLLRCAPQDYSSGGEGGPSIVKGLASGKVRARTPGNRAVAVLLLRSAV